MANTVHGSTRLTTTGTVGVAAKPKIIYGIHIISGATPSVALLKNNGTTGTIYIKETGTANTGKTIMYPEGYLFPTDCFYTADGNQTSVLVFYDEVQT